MKKFITVTMPVEIEVQVEIDSEEGLTEEQSIAVREDLHKALGDKYSVSIMDVWTNP